MKLKVLLPTEILINQEVSRIRGEAENGSFCILPRHIDFVTSLVPGIFSFESNGGEEFLAMDEGILVKRGDEVLVSTKNAVHSNNLETLEDTVEKKFITLEEREKKARSAIAKLEADFVRKFLKTQKYG
jgi:F-type H+-transporting ATPase subunit epsilon